MTLTARATPPPSTSVAPRLAPWFVVAAALFVAAWGGNEFTPLLVLYRDGFSAVAVDAFLFAYVCGIAPAMLICGPLSDRYGRRPLMMPAPMISAIGSAVIAVGAHSAAALVLGRVLSGVALGIGMAVGGSWIKELSTGTSGARRAAMSVTSGFAVGAAVAGVLAQWGPQPEHLPYLVHAVACVIVFAALLRVREHRGSTVAARGRSVWAAARDRRFLRVIAPAAPWVFTSSVVGYAVLPGLMADHSGGLPVAFAALMCAVALTAGVSIQALGRRIDTPTGARAVLVGLGVTVVGLALASVASHVLTVPMALVAAAVLGAGYGMGLVSGLQEVQRIARPGELAGLTAVFYTLTYTGFAAPMMLAALHEHLGLPYPVMFAVASTLAAATLLWVATGSRRDLPAGRLTAGAATASR